MDTDRELRARMARADAVGVHTPKEQLMSDKATMLRETDEAFADLRVMLDWLTEEQASRVWLAVSGVRESLIHIREYPAQNRDWRAALWAPSSFWGLRYPSKRDERRDPA
jgi:hypothetical protein